MKEAKEGSRRGVEIQKTEPFPYGLKGRKCRKKKPRAGSFVGLLFYTRRHGGAKARRKATEDECPERGPPGRNQSCQKTEGVKWFSSPDGVIGDFTLFGFVTTLPNSTGNAPPLVVEWRA